MDKSKSFDDLMSLVGSFGTYQKCIFIIHFVVVMLTLDSFQLNYIGYDQDHWCSVPELISLPFHVQRNVAIPFTDEPRNVEFSRCKVFMYNYTEYTAEEFLSWNRSAMMDSPQTSCDQWQYDQSVMESTMVSQWDLVCGDTWRVPFVPTANMMGLLVVPIWGYFSDRMGRKKMLVMASVLHIVAIVMGTFSPVYSLTVVGRILNGMSTGGMYECGFVLITELAGTEFRSRVGQGLALAYSAGSMMTSGFAYVIRDHVKLQAAMLGPCVLLIAAIVWLFPESPRWLVLRGRHHKAEAIIQHMAEVNGNSLPPDFSITDYSIVQASNASLVTVLKSPRLRRQTFILFINWFTSSLLFYSFNLNSGSLPGDIFLNTFLLGAVEVPANLLCLFMMDHRWFGRRLTCCFALFMTGISSFVTIPILLTGEMPDTVTALAMVGKAGATMIFNGLFIYSTELFPTEVRGAGIGACSFCARISGLGGPFVGGPLQDLWAPLPSLIFGSLGVLTGLLDLTLPETLNKNLLQTVQQAEQDIDSKNAVRPDTRTIKTESVNANTYI